MDGVLLKIGQKNKSIYFDIGIDEEFNNKITTNANVIFIKDDGVRIKWISEKVTLVRKTDGNAIMISIPNKILRMQRREFFRITTPILNPVPCKIPIPLEANTDSEKILNLALLDVGLGGVGVIATAPLHPALIEGASFESCKINFPDVGTADITLQVKNLIPLEEKTGGVKYRIGLQFVDPSRSNESLIHKYTFNLERTMLSLKPNNVFIKK